MFSHIGIKNFATVDQLELELTAGLTTITGETGAGKSVLLDAIGLVMGARGNTQILRDESSNAEITAGLAVPATGAVGEWLAQRDLIAEADTAGKVDEIEIIMRRVITPSGRNRAYINGSAVNVADLKQLGSQLVDLHNQHEHQSLLVTATHQHMLDNFASHDTLTTEVANLSQQWSQIANQIDALTDNSDAKAAQLQLLRYQVQELEQLALQENETSQLAEEQKQLAGADTILASLDYAITSCEATDDSSALNQIQQAIQHLKLQIDAVPALSNCIELLNSAQIQLQEASLELNRIAQTISPDPARLADVESRLDTIYSIARKHKVEPEQLIESLTAMQAQIEALSDSSLKVESLEKEQQRIAKKYATASKRLSQSRLTASKKLEQLVSKKLGELSMAHCTFKITLTPVTTSKLPAGGQENIEFLISTIPDKAPQALAKIASGGELSRISLAIQVVTAQTSTIPVLVFDEVDVGIGGGVAEVVGNLLRDLSQATQVLCVTHLAQVAAKGSTHLRVTKSLSKTHATTRIDTLNKTERKKEMARMIGGIEVTKSTLAHAAEILETA